MKIKTGGQRIHWGGATSRMYRSLHRGLTQHCIHQTASTQVPIYTSLSYASLYQDRCYLAELSYHFV